MHNFISKKLFANYSALFSVIICLSMTVSVFGGGLFGGADEFVAGKPIYPVGLEVEMNTFVGFRAVFDRPVVGC